VEPRTSSLTFLKHVSVSKEVRAAAGAAQSQLSAFEVEAGMRVDVYNAVAAYVAANPDLAAAGLDAEARRFVERTMRDYKRRGLALPEATRERVKAIKTQVRQSGLPTTPPTQPSTVSASPGACRSATCALSSAATWRKRTTSCGSNGGSWLACLTTLWTA